jgi:hypothetical protein
MVKRKELVENVLEGLMIWMKTIPGGKSFNYIPMGWLPPST